MSIFDYSIDNLIDIGKKPFNSITSKHEFEIMFFNFNKSHMTYENYISLMNFIKSKPNKSLSYSLDISINDNNSFISYRISINDLKRINEYIQMLNHKPNYIIVKLLVSLFKQKEVEVSIMKKIKDKENIVDIDDLDIRIRSSIEDNLSEDEIEKLASLSEDSNNKITFRYKQRISVMLEKDDKHHIVLDLTNIKMSQMIDNINNIKSNYELEIELQTNHKNEEYLKNLMNYVDKTLKILQKNNTIITKSENSFVINEYEKILSITKRSSNLYGRQPISIDLVNLIEKLPNKYTVTDKADGDRCFMIIINKTVFLINTNLSVIKTNLNVSEEFNNTICDGEYINGKMLMLFDCLFFKNQDVRTEKSLFERHSKIDELIKKCFVSKKQKGNDFSSLDKFIETLNYDLNNSNGLLIRRKYFSIITGKIDNEIFKASMLIWRNKEKLPYSLDGLIYHPLEQTYVIGKDNILSELKWKPPEKNSIDFYIKIEKDRKTKKELIIFDNSLKIKNKPYKICNLFCGKRSGQNEEPISFNNFKAYIFLDNGVMKTLEGETITDEIVIEFSYNNDTTVDEEFRWIPIRIRYDKTDSVIKFKKRYGNNIEIANKIWNIILNPILIDDIEMLSNDKTFKNHKELLLKKITKEKSSDEPYYQKITEIGKPLRAFHNWIKSNLIRTYFTPYKRKFTVLDIGCGRGGDIDKLIKSNVESVVGIDVDGGTLLSSVNGALSRYNKEKRQNMSVPKMIFIQMDFGKDLSVEIQEKSLGKMNLINKKLINEFQNQTFDRINCQFVVHYFLKDEETFNTFLHNISNKLNNNGYAIFTTFDGDLVYEVIGGKERYELTYTNEIGEKKKFYDIVKKYDKKKEECGMAIDVFNGMISNENIYNTEYLVFYNYFVKKFNDYGFELVESDLFINQYNNNKEFITIVSSYESDERTKKYLTNIKKFYEATTEIDKLSIEVMKLNRYYVFRKTNKINIINEKKEKKTKKKMIGGFRSKKGYDYKMTLFNILQNEHIIPESVKYDEFVEDMGIKKMKSIENINKNIIIEHEVNGKRKKVLNGLKSLILERDCNGVLEKTIYGKGKKFIKVIKEDETYYPIYMKNENEKQWLYEE